MFYFVMHIMAATLLLGFILCWLGWLWFIICRPAAWARSVSRQHAVMLRYGLNPGWSKVIVAWETGWPMKALMAVTIGVAMWVQRLF
jgi:hypothetical protein